MSNDSKDFPGTSSDLDQPLSVADAAWLARVNDDTVRKWLKHPGYPRTDLVSIQGTTTWNELARWLANRGKAQPLPLMLLHVSAVDLEHVLGRATQPEVSSSPIETAPARPHQADVRASTQPSAAARARELEEQVVTLSAERVMYRRMLRERIAGASHARNDAAAADRALGILLDAKELDDNTTT